jgi:hypothetical protein
MTNASRPQGGIQAHATPHVLSSVARPRREVSGVFASAPWFHHSTAIAFWAPVINAPHTGNDWLATLLAPQLGLNRRITRFPSPVHT